MSEYDDQLQAAHKAIWAAEHEVSTRTNVWAKIALLGDLERLRSDLAIVLDTVHEKVYGAMGTKEITLPDGSVVERYTTSTTKWDNEEVVKRLRRSCADPDTGEIDPMKVAERIAQCAHIGYWRVRDLSQYIEVDDEVRSKEWGKRRIRLPDRHRPGREDRAGARGHDAKGAE